MRIRYRLLLGFMSVVSIFIVFGGYVYWVWQSISEDMQKLDQLYETTAKRSLHSLDSSLHMSLALEASHSALLDFSLGEPTALGRLTSELNEFDTYYEELSVNLSKSQDPESDELLAALAIVESEHEQFRGEIAALVQIVNTEGINAASQLWRDHLADEFFEISAALETIEAQIEQRTDTISVEFDESIHQVEIRIHSLQNLMIAVLGIAILTAFTIGYFTAKAISVPIEQLSEAAIAIEEGIYESNKIEPVVIRRDELGRFARIFQHMAEQIYQREQQLRARIDALRIEVNRKKSQQQAAEITDTEFFKDLQAQARAIRADSTSSES